MPIFQQLLLEYGGRFPHYSGFFPVGICQYFIDTDNSTVVWSMAIGRLIAYFDVSCYFSSLGLLIL